METNRFAWHGTPHMLFMLEVLRVWGANYDGPISIISSSVVIFGYKCLGKKYMARRYLSKLLNKH